MRSSKPVQAPISQYIHHQSSGPIGNGNDNEILSDYRDPMSEEYDVSNASIPDQQSNSPSIDRASTYHLSYTAFDQTHCSLRNWLQMNHFSVAQRVDESILNAPIKYVNFEDQFIQIQVRDDEEVVFDGESWVLARKYSGQVEAEGPSGFDFMMHHDAEVEKAILERAAYVHDLLQHTLSTYFPFPPLRGRERDPTPIKNTLVNRCGIPSEVVELLTGQSMKAQYCSRVIWDILLKYYRQEVYLQMAQKAREAEALAIASADLNFPHPLEADNRSSKLELDPLDDSFKEKLTALPQLTSVKRGWQRVRRLFCF